MKIQKVEAEAHKVTRDRQLMKSYLQHMSATNAVILRSESMVINPTSEKIGQAGIG